MTFHEQLASLRRARGISQEILAEQLGVSRQAVSKWETGASQPELGNILALCRILEVSPNELLGEDVPVAAQTDMSEVAVGTQADSPEIRDLVTSPPMRTMRPVRIIVIYALCMILLILLGLGLKSSMDRGKAPRIESCYVYETRDLDHAREFTLKITYDFLPEDQPNQISLILNSYAEDIYKSEYAITVKDNVGYVTFLLPYNARCTVQHQSKAKSTLHLQDILKITRCTREDYNQELLLS